MLKDDRMMSMLTFVVIMATIGTILQRVDLFEKFFGGGEAQFELVRDEMIVRANALTEIDVLANDLGIVADDKDRLIVVTQPPCGRAEAQGGKVQYVAAESCAGPQSFSYAISGRVDGMTGEVLAVVRVGDPTPNQVAADAQRDIATPTPAAARSDEPRNTRDPSVLAAQPEGSNQVLAAPAVPRPQTGQASRLTDPAARTAAGAAAGLSPGADAGTSPSIVLPSDQAAGGVLPAADGPGARPPQPEPQAGRPADGGAVDNGNLPATAGIRRDAPSDLGGGQVPVLPSDAPATALGTLLGQGGTGGLTPVNTAPPPDLAAATPSGQAPQPQPESGTEAQVPVSCVEPPTLTLDIRPGGLTGVSVHSPCDALTVARVEYDGLAIGFLLDGVGLGTVSVPGLQPSSNAELMLGSGNGFSFDLAFEGTETMDRVAVVWQAPVQLDLHAFEFGAAEGSPGHVSPAQPRGFDTVRRGGGGYLTSWQAVRGQGQNVSVYTYLRRPGGPTGVVDLKLDFASRKTGAAPETCGEGAQARPDFMVIRSLGGQSQKLERRRLAALDCDAVATTERLIGDAVDDILILRR